MITKVTNKGLHTSLIISSPNPASIGFSNGTNPATPFGKNPATILSTAPVSKKKSRLTVNKKIYMQRKDRINNSSNIQNNQGRMHK